MKVLVLGLCRTGTTSIKVALKQLGYQDVYDTEDIWECDSGPMWCEAIDAKFKRGENIRFDQEPWTSAFKNYDCIADIPAAMFAAELIASFPDAKVILTTRSLESWMVSMRQTVVDPLNTSLYYRAVSLVDGQFARFANFCRAYEDALWKNDFETYGAELFVNHGKLIHDLARHRPGSQNDTASLLEFRAVDGWVPLCEYLGKPVPADSYPRTHSAKEFREGDRAYLRSKYLETLRNVVLVAAPVLAAWMYWRSRQRI